MRISAAFAGLLLLLLVPPAFGQRYGTDASKLLNKAEMEAIETLQAVGGRRSVGVTVDNEVGQVNLHFNRALTVYDLPRLRLISKCLLSRIRGSVWAPARRRACDIRRFARLRAYESRRLFW
jgi:hypothetical protein